MTLEKACLKCLGCRNHKGCVEYHRLCVRWTTPVTNYYAASSTAASSVHFDLAVGDLTMYKEVVEKVRALAIDLDMALDDLPRDVPQRSNPRYGNARLNQDVQHEDVQLSNVETVLLNFQLHRDRLHEVDDEPEVEDFVPGLPADLPPTGHLLYNTAPKSLLDMLALVQNNLTEPRTEVLEPLRGAGYAQARTEADRVDTTQPANVGNAEEKGASQVSEEVKDPPVRNGHGGGQPAEGPLAEKLSDKLFNLDTRICVRRNEVAVRLVSLEEAMTAQTEVTFTASTEVSEGLRQVQDLLRALEPLEMDTWLLTAHLRGADARNKRAKEWTAWHANISLKVSQVRRLLWQQVPGIEASTSVPVAASATPCLRSGGHVEKVKLPSFSGRLEEYHDFRSQFRQLCDGEKYSPVIELAQLRPKLPKEAVLAISGLEDPITAWQRLDKLYGNREMAIVTALHLLRNFKATKTAPQDIVIELAAAVQRCATVLRRLRLIMSWLTTGRRWLQPSTTCLATPEIGGSSETLRTMKAKLASAPHS